MKEKIVKFFKEDRSYLGAIRLYTEVGNSLSVKKQINLQPEKVMKGILFDQLRILAGITPDDFKIIQATPLLPSAPLDEKKDDINIILQKPKLVSNHSSKKQHKTSSAKKQSPKTKENPAKK